MPLTRSRSSDRASLAPRWADSTSSLMLARSARLTAVPEFLPGHAQAHRQRGQPDLRAVVQVPFHLPQLRRGVIDGPRPGLLQLADPLLEPPRAEQAPDEPAIGGDGGPGHPGRGEHRRGADRERGEGARIGADAEQHPVAGGQRVEDTDRAQPGAWRVVAEQRPPQRVGQVGQADRGHVDREALQRGGWQLEQHVGHGPPGGAVPEPGVQPAQHAVARAGTRVARRPGRRAAIRPACGSARPLPRRRWRRGRSAAAPASSPRSRRTGRPPARAGARRR